MKKAVLILAVYLPILLFGQVNVKQLKEDSLKRLLNPVKKDSTRVFILEELGHYYSSYNPKLGLAYAAEAFQLASELNLKEKVASSISVMAINKAALMDFEKAIEYNQQALKIYQGLNQYIDYAAVSTNLSLIYLNMGKYANALSSGLAALAIYDTAGELRNRAIALENIGSIYFELKKFTASESYYKEALILFDSLHNKEDIARCSGNMARVYTELNATEQALRLLFKAYRMNVSMQKKSGIIINLTNIGNAYLKLKRYDSAVSYFNQSLNLSKEQQLMQFVAFNKGNLGTVYLQQFKFSAGMDKPLLLDKAIENLQTASTMCDSFGLNAPMLEFEEALLEAFTLKRDFANALNKYKIIAGIKDSMQSIEMRAAIAKLETQRALELKDKDILIRQNELEIEKLRDQKRTVIYFLVILFLSFLIFLFARIHLSRVNARKKEVLELKQIHAHQVRGPVATILGLADLLKVIGSDNKHSADELINGIESEAKRLDRIITGIIKREDN